MDDFKKTLKCILKEEGYSQKEISNLIFNGTMAYEKIQNVTKRTLLGRVLYFYLTIIEIDTLTAIPATLSFSDTKKMKCSFD